MAKVTQTSSRKADHIRINLEEDVSSGASTGLERFYFPNEALPEINLADVDLSLQLLGKKVSAPILISSMTGGSKEAGMINSRLAEAAQDQNIAMGLGSQRAAIEDQSLVDSFKVRDLAPDILLFANIGAVQLNYGYGLSECQAAVDMVGADALILHLNALQEAVQPEGDTKFSGLLEKIEAVCHKLPVSVIVKEIGWGISVKTAKALIDAGVRAIDVAGAGGTSWTQVEMKRAKNASQARTAAAFADWGIPTADAIIAIHGTHPEIEIFASGGLRTGLDIAKCIALGARIGGLASPFLKAADHSSKLVVDTIREISREIQVALFAAGAANLEQAAAISLVEKR